MSQREGRIAIAQTCGRWGGHGFDEALYRALRRNGLTASPVWGDTLADSDELRQHVVVFRIDKEEDATRTVIIVRRMMIGWILRRTGRRIRCFARRGYTRRRRRLR